MPNNINNDITIGILLKLPAESLLRFKCICKSWRSLIEDRKFIEQHCYHKIFLSCWKGEYYYAYSIDAPLQHDSVVSDITLPPGIDHTLSRNFVSSCNGLFLVAFPSRKIVLWNPAIKKSRTIPRPIPTERDHIPALYRLGYVSSFDDYKIVKVGPPFVQIFSTKSNSWKSIMLPQSYCFDGDMIVADEIVYMIMRKPISFILCLCLKDKKFQNIKYPNASDLSIDNPSLYTLGECLFLTKFSTPINNMVDFEVWRLKKNGTDRSWCKMLAITVPDTMHTERFWIQPVGFMKDGNILFLRDHEAHDFVVYDSKRKKLKEVKVAGLGESVCLFWAITYAETLISLKAM